MLAFWMAVFHISRTWFNALNCDEQVEYSLKRNSVTAVLGPRPCGQTIWAREIGRQENGVASASVRDDREGEIDSRTGLLKDGVELGRVASSLGFGN